MYFILFFLFYTLATSCEELMHWKRLWCWERLGAWGEGDDRGWDGWMASPSRWTWVWVNSGSWWWTGRPGVLQFTGSQRVGHDWATELNWTHMSRSKKSASHNQEENQSIETDLLMRDIGLTDKYSKIPILSILNMYLRIS